MPDSVYLLIVIVLLVICFSVDNDTVRVAPKRELPKINEACERLKRLGKDNDRT